MQCSVKLWTSLPKDAEGAEALSWLNRMLLAVCEHTENAAGSGGT